MASKYTACGLPLLFLICFEFTASKTRNEEFVLQLSNPITRISQNSSTTHQAVPVQSYLQGFRFTIWQLTQAAYRYGNTDDLNSFLCDYIDPRNPSGELSLSVVEELHDLLVRLTVENHFAQGEQPAYVQFKVVTNELYPLQYSVYYSPQEGLGSYGTFCGCPSLLLAFDIPDFDHCIENAPAPFSHQVEAQRTDTLHDPNPNLTLDLTLDFLEILKNPDRRIF